MAADTANGFVEGSFLCYKAKNTDGNHHGEMNGDAVTTVAACAIDTGAGQRTASQPADRGESLSYQGEQEGRLHQLTGNETLWHFRAAGGCGPKIMRLYGYWANENTQESADPIIFKFATDDEDENDLLLE